MSVATATSGMFEERIDPGKLSSFVLAALVHLLLLAILLFGVRWQNRPPESIAVELWEPPPPPAQVEPAPVPRPEPAPVVVKPEPVVPRPEIVEKKAPPPKPEPKVEPKHKVEPTHKVEPKPKPEPPKAAVRPRNEEVQRHLREQLNREMSHEQAALAMDREKHLRDQLAKDAAAAANNKSMADWVNKVRAKIRGNVALPPDIKGNPEAIFDVVQLPTGEVLSVRVRKSSGHAALDSAIERAILKSSPLPRPDRGESAPRAFELKYRPLD